MPRKKPMHDRRRAQRPHQKRRSCVVPILLLGLLVIAVAGGYLLFGRATVSQYVAQEQLEAQVEQVLPTAIAVLPRGKVIVSDKQVNAYIAANPGMLDPIEQATLHFVPGQVQVDLQAYGTTNQISMGLQAQNGRIAVVNPRLDGPLALLISFEDVIRTLEEQINAQFDTQGRAIQDIRIEQGQMMVFMQ